MNCESKKAANRWHTFFSSACALVLVLYLAGCGSSDPRDKLLPSDGRLTAAEAESIAAKLDVTEAEAFRRWAARMRKGEYFGGEGIAHSVRDAVISQQTFEFREADQIASAQRLEKEKQELQRAQEQLERDRLDEIYSHRQAVNAEIQKHIEGAIVSYTPKTFYDALDRPKAGTIEFRLRIANRYNRAAIGLAGFVNIADVFGRNLGSYPFAIEPRVPAGSEINYSVSLDFDPRNAQHQAIWKAQTLRHTWFFESAVFEGDIRIDASTIKPGSSPVRTPTTAQTKTNT